MHQYVKYLHLNWEKKIDNEGSIEQKVFAGTQKLISIRKKLEVVSDYKNLTWLQPHNIHVAGYLRTHNEDKLYCIFNFTATDAYLTWFAFKQHGKLSDKIYDHWNDKYYEVGFDHEYFILEPYSFYLIQPVL